MGIESAGGWSPIEAVPEEIPMKDYTQDIINNFPVIKNEIEQKKVTVQVGANNAMNFTFPFRDIVTTLATYTDFKNNRLQLIPGKKVPEKDEFWVNALVNKDDTKSVLMVLHNTLKDIVRSTKKYDIAEIAKKPDWGNYDITLDAALILAASALQVPNIKFLGWKQSDPILEPGHTNQYVRYRNVGWTRNGEIRSLGEVPMRKETKAKPQLPDTTIEKTEVLNIKQVWNHAEALVDPCVLSTQQIDMINKKLDQGVVIKFNISAGIDGRPVRERSWDTVDNLYEQAKSTAKLHGYEGVHTTLLKKSTIIFNKYPKTSARDANKSLIIARALKSAEEIYCKIFEPRIKALPQDQQQAQKKALIAMIHVNSLTIGNTKTPIADMQKDRYTQLDA